MARVSITELPIRVFKGLRDEDGCVALIGNLPVIVKAPTPMKAMTKAKAFAAENCKFKGNTNG